MRRFLIAATVALSLLPAMAYALSLDEAKSQGLVGERMDGYLGPVVTRADVTTLVKEINNARREEYGRIAAENKQPMEVIQKIAAEKAYRQTRSGHYVQSANGSWQKK